MSGGKVTEHTLERNPSGDYEDFINKVAKSFIESFKFDIDCRITPKNKVKSWFINEKRLLKIKNILVKTLQEEIAKEDMKTINSATNAELKRLEKLIQNAKEDLRYINDEVVLKTKEVF